MKKTSVLAFDCACFGGNVSLSVGETMLSRQLSQQNQASHLVSTIAEMVREAGISFDTLDSIVTTTGPGSFTGLRIGLAALHGFVLVNATPLKTLGTLEAMAWHIARLPQAPKHFSIAIRAGKGELYTQAFHCERAVPHAMDAIGIVPETANDWPHPCFGNAWPQGHALYLAAPDTETLCAIADQLPHSCLADAMPLYIRPPDALIPATPAWLVP